jgi:AraC family L-rhamnose operon transcriptional activator RhaR
MEETALLSTKTTLFYVLMKIRSKSPFREAPLQPLLLRNLQLRCGDWSIRSLRVNRHLQPFDRVAPHRHPHGQLLLYLRGRGEQQVDQKKWSVGAGAVFFIPPGKKHAFRETGPRRAICLVVDLAGGGVRRWGFRHGFLPAERMAEVRQRVAGMGVGRSSGLELSAGSAALLVLDVCRQACRGGAIKNEVGSPVIRRLERVWRMDEEGKWPRPGELAKRVGLQKDYLNRMVRLSSGLTLGQWRAGELLRSVEADIKKGLRVFEVASRAGFTDQNYFSRWFRKQTGLAPTRWHK